MCPRSQSARDKSPACLNLHRSPRLHTLRTKSRHTLSPFFSSALGNSATAFSDILNYSFGITLFIILRLFHVHN